MCSRVPLCGSPPSSTTHREDVFVVLDLGFDGEGLVAEVPEATAKLLSGTIILVVKGLVEGKAMLASLPWKCHLKLSTLVPSLTIASM